MAHLPKRLKSERDRRAELAPFWQQSCKVLNGGQIGQLVEDQPNTSIGRWRQAEHRAGGAFEPASEKRLGGFEIILLAWHEYPRTRPNMGVERADIAAKREWRAARSVAPKELDEVGGLGEHEDDAAGRPLRAFCEGSCARRIAQPEFQLLGVFGLQCVEQCFETAIALRPQSAEHVGNKDTACLQPDIVIAAAGLRYQLMRNPVGVGGMRDFFER